MDIFSLVGWLFVFVVRERIEDVKSILECFFGSLEVASEIIADHKTVALRFPE